MTKKPITITKTVANRLVREPGKARRWLDPKTGNTFSRRQVDKVKGRKALPAFQARKNKQALATYVRVRDSYIGKQKAKGIAITKRGAMESAELKEIVKDLKKGAKLKRQGKVKEGNKLMLKALKKTGLRDGIKDSIPVGMSPKAGDDNG